MNCKNCGSALADGAEVCTACGSLQTANQETAVETKRTTLKDAAAATMAELNSIGTTAFVLSMVGAGLCWFGFVGISLILALISRSKLKTYREMGGELHGLTTAANIVSLITVILSAIALGIVVLVLLFYIVYLAVVLVGFGLLAGL